MTSKQQRRSWLWAVVAIFAFGGQVVRGEDGNRFQTIRDELRAKYDANGDGRLDEAERETMRLERKQASQTRQGRGRRRQWSPPAEWLERYDADGDGDLSQQERDAAFAGEQERIRKAYDSDGDGSLGEGEKKKLVADVQGGKFEGMDRFMAMQVGGMMQRRGRGGADGSASQRRWLEFDADGDGKASAEELRAIRESLR